jgi:hypothetical protein
MGAREAVSRALVMVVRLNAESLAIAAVTDSAVVSAQFGQKLGSMRILMTSLAPVRGGDKPAHRHLALYIVTLDARNSLVSPV